MIGDFSKRLARLLAGVGAVAIFAACAGGLNSPSALPQGSQTKQITPRDANGLACNERFYLKGNIQVAQHTNPPSGYGTAYFFMFQEQLALTPGHQYEFQYWAGQYSQDGSYKVVSTVQHTPIYGQGQQVNWTVSFFGDPCYSAGMYFQDIVWDLTANAPANGSGSYKTSDGEVVSQTNSNPSATCAPDLRRPGQGGTRNPMSMLCMLGGAPTDPFAVPDPASPTPPPCKKQPCPLSVVRRAPAP